MTETFVDIRQSELSTAHRCRRKAFIRYEMGWQPHQPDGDVRGVGTLVHGLLAQYYDPSHISADLEHDFSDEDLFLGTVMFDTYKTEVESEGLDIGIVTEFVERRLWSRPYSTPLGDVRVSAQLDHVYTDRFGRLVGQDHKTVATFFETAPTDFQLLTNAVILADNGMVPDQMQHNIIKRNKRSSRSKPPYLQRNTIDVDAEMLASHREQLYEHMYSWAKARHFANGNVEDGRIWAVGKNDCSWSCDYYDVCGMISSGDDYLAVLQSEYYQEEAPQ